MAAAGKKNAYRFFFYALPRSFYAKTRAQEKAFCRICAQSSAYYAPRMDPDAYCSCQRQWNNFLSGIFLYVLKLFQSWNNIPRLSVAGGIMIFQLFQVASTERNEIFHSGNNIPATVYYAASASYLVQPSDIDIMPPEKIAFIAYNVGIFESVQKFGNLITGGKIAGGMDPERVAELLAESRAFYDSEMIAQLVNGMLAQRASANLPMTVDRVTASQVDYVLSQLKAAGVQL